MDADLWLIAVPGSDGGRSSFQKIRDKSRSDATMSEFHIPELKVGPIDTLMALNEEMGKVDLVAKSLVVKLQRNYVELMQQNNEKPGPLLVRGSTPRDYLEHFRWEEARFPTRRKLPDLVQIIRTAVAKVEDDMRVLTADHAEVKSKLTSVKRKQGGNLIVADLDDVLTMDRIGIDPREIFFETDYLMTVAVVVPKDGEKEFLETYERLDGGAVALREGPGGASNISPVVPKSAQRLLEDGDGYVLYAVVLLKGPEGGFLESFTKACMEKRFTVREYTPAVRKAKGGESKNDDDESLAAKVARLEVEEQHFRNELLRRSAPYFEEVYQAWIHIKAIRIFVESVLRWAVPVNYECILVSPNSSKGARRTKDALLKEYQHLDPKGAGKIALDNAQTSSALADMSAGGEFLPYVHFSVEVH